jgi:ribosome-associated protein
MVTINDKLSIPDEEFSFEYARSSGPGGQNVNKVNTKATLCFDIGGSRSLSDEQRDRIRQKLRTRITKEGVLRVASQRHRTQRANQEAAVERFAELIREALARRRPRRKTKTPRAAHERRLQEKKRRAALKRERGKAKEDD